MEPISERIQKGLVFRNMKQADLVKKTGIGKSSISTYLSGSYEPKQKNICKMAKALNVNEAWLRGYDVPMERQASIESFYGPEKQVFSNEELDLIHKYRSIDEKGKYTVTTVLKVEYDRCQNKQL